MPNWMKLAVGWFFAAVVAFGLAWGAVAQVRNQVIRPSVAIPATVFAAEAGAVETPSSTTTVDISNAVPKPGDGTSSTSQSLLEATGNGPASSVPTGSALSTIPSGPASEATSTTSTSPQPPADSTGTTSPTVPESSTTTSTTVPAPTQTSSYQLAGGTVTISYSPGVVNFVSAIPRPGFSTDLDKTGPETVKVKFESDDHTSEFEAKWSNGELEISEREQSKGSD